MKDEIKEILDYLNEFIKSDKVEQIYLNQKRVKQLLDYITNLQEENERLKENAIHNDKVVDKAKWNEMLYKSRIDKAIEYIISNFVTDNPVKFKNTLYDILTGSDKE